jgi:hypothetical protein
MELVENFKSCVKYRLLRGYVGLDLLWERQKSILPPAHDCTGPVLTRLLQYGRVHPFDPATDKYKVVYRDGLSTWKTEPEIKQAQNFTVDMTMGRNKKWSFDDARLAQEERVQPVLVTVLGTQVEDSPCVSVDKPVDLTLTPLVPDKVDVSGASLPIVPTQQSKDENPSTTSNASDDGALQTPKPRSRTSKSK